MRKECGEVGPEGEINTCYRIFVAIVAIVLVVYALEPDPQEGTREHEVNQLTPLSLFVD